MAVSTRLTIEDFEKLPDEIVYYRELVDGELVDVSGNNPEHNSLRDLLISLLLPYVRLHRLGKVIAEQEYQFGNDAHGPDVTFLRPEKAAAMARRRRIQPFVPDLAIEIASPSDTMRSLLAKGEKYVCFGTEEVWLIFIDERQVIRIAAAGRSTLDLNQTLETLLLPGFSVRISDLLNEV